jgi:RND family efflux transporter MFP subunit
MRAVSRLRRRRIVLIVAFGMFVAGCSEKKSVEQPITPVAVAPVAQYSGGEDSKYSANITPNVQVSLAFKSAGYVTSILEVHGADGRTRYVDQGDWVKKGTVLAAVRQDDYNHVVQQYTGQLGQAQAAATHAQENFQRASALYAANALTQTDYDNAKSQLDSSSSAVITAQAGLSQAQQSLADTQLAAPIDGWIAVRNIDVGDLAGTGTVGFGIVDTHLVKAEFGIPDVLLSRVQLGQSQMVDTESLPEPFTGRVTAISPVADQKSRVFQVEVTIPNPHNQLKAGMIATINLGQGRFPHPLLVVPLSAVIAAGDGTKTFSVFVVTHEGGKDVARRRKIELGDTYGNRVVVQQGLSLGEIVISNGATQVIDGQTIRTIQ